MPKRILRALVGGYKPRTPDHSLPSYGEPTPETNPRLTREEEAELALKRTEFTRGTPLLLVTLFLLTIISVPLLQFAAEWRAHQPGVSLPMFDAFKALPSATRIGAVRSLGALVDLLPHAAELKGAEKTLEADSVVSQWLLPTVQSVLIGKLRAANEQVYLGRDGWLFYRPDVDYVTGPPFLHPTRLRQRAHSANVQPDPVKAIVQFRDQLAARGIELLLVPVPTKASIEGAMLSAGARSEEPLQNSSFAEFKAQLTARGVRLLDCSATLMGTSAPRYLRTDTHWRPETMQLVAQKIAQESGGVIANPVQSSAKQITGTGDVARMLKLPDGQQLYPAESVTIQQVTTGNNFWRPTRDADVLLLGDSFANMFSLDALGWGESAGIAEHLSAALGGRPLDCILRNSDGAFATREMLASELARGRDRLAGKKLVIWEFAARELSFGNWKLVDLKLGQPTPARFFVPRAGEAVEVTGTVEAVAFVPRPGTVPYKDHVVSVHLSDVTIAAQNGTAPLQALVYLESMRDNIWTSAARLRPGDHVTLRLRAWSDVAAQHEQTNRSEIDDPAVQLEEPAWGELVK